MKIEKFTMTGLNSDDGQQVIDILEKNGYTKYRNDKTAFITTGNISLDDDWDVSDPKRLHYVFVNLVSLPNISFKYFIKKYGRPSWEPLTQGGYEYTIYNHTDMIGEVRWGKNVFPIRWNKRGVVNGKTVHNDLITADLNLVLIKTENYDVKPKTDEQVFNILKRLSAVESVVFARQKGVTVSKYLNEEAEKTVKKKVRRK